MGGGVSKRSHPPSGGGIPNSSPAPSSTCQPCQLIDGKGIAAATLVEVRKGVDELVAQGFSVPSLVVVIVGSNPASLSYIKRKMQAAEECGIAARELTLPETSSEAEILQAVQSLNADDDVHGVIVQLPLPSHVHEPSVTQAVCHAKDVDGFTMQSLGSVANSGQEPCFCPCTPKGCLKLIQSALGTKGLRGCEAVVIGASNIVGVPMGLLLVREGCTVTTCHIDTKDVAFQARMADILVVAVGKAGLVQRDWVKPGAVVIDVGINFVSDPTKKSGQKMVGDCAPEVKEVAGHLTPVPGGVGPMTVAMLMDNTLQARRRLAKLVPSAADKAA